MLLYSEHIKNFLYLIRKAEDLNRHITKNVWMTCKHTERCSTSLDIRNMKIDTTMRCHHYWNLLEAKSLHRVSLY